MNIYKFFFTAILGEIVFGAPNCDFFCAGTEDHLAADQSFRVLAMAEGIVNAWAMVSPIR